MPLHVTAEPITRPAAQLLGGSLYVGDIPNLDPLTQARLGYLMRYERKPSTKRDYTRMLDEFLTWCEAQHVDPLTATRPQVEMYLLHLKNRGHAEATVSLKWCVVTGFYKRAAIDKLITDNPTIDIPRPQVDATKQHRTWLNPLQSSRILTAAEQTGPDAHALIQLMLVCFLRVHEACSLTTDSLGRDKRGRDVIRYIGKGDKAAVTVLPRDVLKSIEKLVDLRGEGHLLRNAWGRPMDTRAARRLVKRLAVAADVDPTTVACHTFRRTGANTALLMGRPVHEVAAGLRHADVKVTIRSYVNSDGFDDTASQTVAAFLASFNA